jgi:hypothetical protein
MKLILNGGSYKVSIPKQIVELVLKWKDKDELNVEYENDKIVITKKGV